MLQMMKEEVGQRNGDLFSENAMGTLSLGDAVYYTAHNFPGGVPALASRMRCNVNTLMHKVSVTNSTHHLTLPEAVTMQSMTGDYSILHSMAAHLGHVAVAQSVSSDGRLDHDVAKIAGAFAGLLACVTAAMGDRSVTMNDMRKCEARASEMMAAIGSALCSVRSQVGGR